MTTEEGFSDPKELDIGESGEFLPIGHQLGPYRIRSVLGTGGFAITYLAEHQVLGKLVAIKEHFPRQFAYRQGQSVRATMHSAKTYGWGLERFQEEGQKLAKFRHPAIVEVADLFAANGTAYMVLAYEEGQDLGKWLTQIGRAPTQAELDRIAAPLLDAVELMHKSCLWHRDIAPDNIILRPDGSPVLIDFGSAREAIGRSSQLMSAIVKHHYSPPEQYAADAAFQGPWSDIYALGATLYRAATGATPAQAADRSIQDNYVPAARAAKADYRRQFLDAIDWALRLDLKTRPQTIAEWRPALLGQQTVPEPGEARRPGRRWPALAAALVAIVSGGILMHSLLVAPYLRQRADAEIAARADADAAPAPSGRRRSRADATAAEARARQERAAAETAAEAERQRKQAEAEAATIAAERRKALAEAEAAAAEREATRRRAEAAAEAERRRKQTEAEAAIAAAERRKAIAETEAAAAEARAKEEREAAQRRAAAEAAADAERRRKQAEAEAEARAREQREAARRRAEAEAAKQITPGLSCTEQAVINWLESYGAYGDRELDTSIYEEPVRWIVNGKAESKTHDQMTEEEDNYREIYPVRRFTMKSASTRLSQGQCTLSMQVESYKERKNGKVERGSFNLGFTIKARDNEPRIVEQTIDVLARW